MLFPVEDGCGGLIPGSVIVEAVMVVPGITSLAAATDRSSGDFFLLGIARTVWA